jgi:hypothetical protein
MWRVDLGDVGKNGSSDPDEWTVKKIFEPDISEKRKIFYPPDVTFEKDSTGEYEMLSSGQGIVKIQRKSLQLRTGYMH